MPSPDQSCYVFIQPPGTFAWVLCGLLRVRETPGAFRGSFVYGRSYLARPNVAPLDRFHMMLSDRPLEFTKLKGTRRLARCEPTRGAVG